jgi:hypothetical protein
MKIWVDDVRPAPEGYVWYKSVEEAIMGIRWYEYAFINEEEEGILENLYREKINLIDIDHDAGEYAKYGGDYIKLLDWLEETGRNYPIHIHSQNPVGVENMRKIIRRNGWKEV